MNHHDWIEEHVQRFRKPDGYCIHCGRPANQYHPVGPITITTSEPDDLGEIFTHEFLQLGMSSLLVRSAGPWRVRC
jgi:hypothetical protein